MDRKAGAAQLGLGDQLDIVVCGSMARHEMSGASDFDYLIIAHGLVEDASKTRAFRVACDEWSDQRAIDRPGATGIFGKVISVSELVEQIGLEFDTNRSLTRRILLIEEGNSVLEPTLHRRFVKVAFSRYLADTPYVNTGPPRFLFNDISRYWRTVAVDYQAKVWERLDETGWGLRYLKLRISRKLTFAASLVPLLLVSLRRPEDIGAFLLEQYVEFPPLARLAQLTAYVGDDSAAQQALRDILLCADAFADFLADSERREQAVAVTALELEGGAESAFTQMRDHSSHLQACLEVLFLDSHVLGPPGRKYLTF